MKKNVTIIHHCYCHFYTWGSSANLIRFCRYLHKYLDVTIVSIACVYFEKKCDGNLQEMEIKFRGLLLEEYCKTLFPLIDSF